MPVHDFKSERLYVDAPLETGVSILCTRDQRNYLCNVLRLKTGDQILVFNGRDGEWRTSLSEVAKRTCTLTAIEKVRQQHDGPPITYLFAPLKRARLDYMVQKAVEMGVATLTPVMTRHTIVDRVNLERMRANVIEAAEQCGVLRLPTVEQPVTLDAVLKSWPPGDPLIFCDEGADTANPANVLSQLKPGPLAVLIGPEGGFSPAERDAILRHPAATNISLGPRIMRADTAAVAALALVNTYLGDWR